MEDLTQSDTNASEKQPLKTNDVFTRRRFIGAVSTIGSVALAGCEAIGGGGTNSNRTQHSGKTRLNTESGQPERDGTLHWSGGVPVQGLDPHLESAASSQRVLENIMEGLVRLNFDYSFSPHLAKSIDRADDNLALTFNLRKGVTFHDGTEMTSEDVLASYRRVASGGFLASGYFKFVDSMEAPDKYTFVIHLTEPFPPLIARMSSSELAILPKEQTQKNRVKEPIGTGPFEFESRVIGSEFVMGKYDEYWRDDLPHLDKVVKTQISEGAIRLQSFFSEDFHLITGVPPKDVQRVKTDPGSRFEKQFPKALVYLGMNCQREPFDDLHARLALDYAIDKKLVAQAALWGAGKTTASPAAPGSPWVNPDVEPRQRDLEKAKEHLEKSEYPAGYTASFQIPQQYPAQVTAAKVIADFASDADINLDIQLITWSTWLSQVYSKQDFQATTSSYLGLYYPDVSFYKFLHPKGAFFFTGWVNEEYNKRVEKARHMTDMNRRKELYYEATEILHDQRAGHLFLFWRPGLYASTNRYNGKIGAPDGSALRFADNRLAQQ